MKIKNNIFESGQIQAINELIAQPLPVAQSYKLMKFAKELAEKEKVYMEAKMSIFKKYGKEKDGQIEIEKKNQKQATAEIDELLELEEEYEFEGGIKLPEDIKLSAAQIMLIEDFVTIE